METKSGKGQPVKLLFIVMPHWDMDHLTSRITGTLKTHTSSYTTVKSKEEYFALPEKERYTYDVLAVWGLPGIAKALVTDQMEHSK